MGPRRGSGSPEATEMESVLDANLGNRPWLVKAQKRMVDLPFGVRGPLRAPGSAPAPHPGPDYKTNVSCQADR